MPLGANKAAMMGTAGVATETVVLLDQNSDTTDIASVTFNSGIDSTYGEYIFKFYNINAATDQAHFQFGVNATDDDGGDYDQSQITSSFWVVGHNDTNGSTTYMDKDGTYDQANGTAFQTLAKECGNEADQACVGELHLFNPASTTYVKHFQARFSQDVFNQWYQEHNAAGYINDATAIDDIQFKMSSGNFDGLIKMWGVK